MIPKHEQSLHLNNVADMAHHFTVSMTPTLAKILSSQTYSDKQLAAIREPLSNAYDSHVRAGTDKPVDLHLPNHLEPWFSVRDYGTGISHDEVKRLFFSFGVSDKHGTNAEIGGLGLGAKAYRAYTDICSITSWFQGVERQYAASNDDKGLPQGQLVYTGESTLPNGVEIRFPVSPKDFEAFRTKTEQVLTYLPLPYTSNIKLHIQKPKAHYTATINGFKLELTEGTKVVMGGIAYDIPHSLLTAYAREKVGVMLNDLRCHIYLPIGAVEISASRESLSPTEKDKEFLVNLLFKFKEHLNHIDWSQDIAKADNWIQAVKIRTHVYGLLGSHIFYGGDYTKRMEWRGIATEGMFRLPDGTVPVVRIRDFGRRRTVYKPDTLNAYNANYQITHAFWATEKEFKKVRYQEWIAQNAYSACHSNSSEIFLVIKADDEAKAKEIASLIGVDIPLQHFSVCHTTAPKAPKKPGVKRGPAAGRAWINDYQEWRDLSSYAPEQLIWAKDANHLATLSEEIHYLKSKRVVKTIPVAFRAYGVSEESAQKKYGEYPTSISDWLKQQEVDQEVLHDRMKQADIHNGWQPAWVNYHKLCNQYSPIREQLVINLQFPAEVYDAGTIRPWLREFAIGYKPPTKELAKIAKWHETKFDKLPNIVKEALTSSTRFSDDDIVTLYTLRRK